MDAILEQQRRLHEERERVVDMLTKESLLKKSTDRDQINSDHRMKTLRDRYMEASYALCELYEDKDGARKSEVASLSGPNEFAEFYNRLKTVKDFYKNHQTDVNIPMSVEFDEMAKAMETAAGKEEKLANFAAEEGYGKYVDLHEHYLKFVNLKGIEKVDYVTYLTIFDRLFEISKEKKTFEYRKYLDGLLAYLKDYLGRVKPLLDLSDEITKRMEVFEKEWEHGTFPGWPKESGTTGALAHSGAYLDLSPFNSPEELKSLGLDRLKSALMALGLKCGGTLEERAVRLFSTKGKRTDEIDPTLFVGGASKTPDKPRGGGPATTVQTAPASTKDLPKFKETALLEAQFYRLIELLGEQRAATKENVERRQARTVGEEEEEEEAAIAVEAESDEDEDDIPYNPKNLPLGWDGKPIPYWLYKLHGLNINYPCEICGNQVYKGPKAFQRHFSEWRHAHGMRCLGIPNTAHFANITRIKDAVELWKKLKDDKEQTIFKPELEEEFEDTFGNVVSRKIFEDLRRQGLL